MEKICIPPEEFANRIALTQEQMREQDLDLLLCFGNEAEPQFVRYYSNYWPSFELAAVLIPAEGRPLLLIGPESLTFAGATSCLPVIRKLLILRESSEPEYPGAALSTFQSVIREVMDGKTPRSLGIAGYSLMPHVVYRDLAAALEEMGAPPPQHSDLLVGKLRAKKSPAEIACMEEAYRITTCAVKRVLEEIRVGMTEEQVKGIALAEIFAQGGEGEAYPLWVLTGEGSNQAISRCRGKVIREGDLVHLQIGARYQGYASTMGRAVVMGKATPQQRGLIKAALAAQKAILDTAKAGINAKAVSDAHYNTLKELGYAGHILYGPCHGTGLMEGEYPWIESNSDFLLETGMTFCTCVYLGDDQNRIGIRIEDGFLVTEEGTRSFSDYRREIIEVL